MFKYLLLLDGKTFWSQSLNMFRKQCKQAVLLLGNCICYLVPQIKLFQKCDAILTMQNLVNIIDYLDISDYLILKSTHCVISSTTAYCRESLCEDCHVWVQYTSDGQWIETILTVLCVYLEHSCNLCLTMLDERGEWTFTGNGWRRQTERSLTIGHHPPRCIIRNKIMKEQMYHSL